MAEDRPVYLRLRDIIAAAILDGCVTELGMSDATLRARRTALRAAADDTANSSRSFRVQIVIILSCVIPGSNHQAHYFLR